MKESYDLDNLGISPIRASSTRLISHKIGAMTRISDKFGLYITHLENVATDAIWFFLELLKPIMQLSLNFQKEKIDTISAAIALGKVKRKLLKLKNKDVNDFNQIKTMKKYIKELEDGKVEYKTICLKNFEAQLKTCECKKSKEIERIQDTINSRLEENDNEFLIAICGILNCEGWERRNAEGDIDLEFCDQHITHSTSERRTSEKCRI